MRTGGSICTLSRSLRRKVLGLAERGFLQTHGARASLVVFFWPCEQKSGSLDEAPIQKEVNVNG